MKAKKKTADSPVVISADSGKAAVTQGETPNASEVTSDKKWLTAGHKKLILFSVVLLLVLALGGWFFIRQPKPNPTPDKVAAKVFTIDDAQALNLTDQSHLLLSDPDPKTQPTDAQAKALVLATRGKNKEALAIFKQITSHPVDYSYHVNYALLAGSNGDLKLAVVQLETAEKRLAASKTTSSDVKKSEKAVLDNKLRIIKEEAGNE